MNIQFGNYNMHTWFCVHRVEESGKEQIGIFEELEDAVDFARNQSDRTIIEVEYE